MKKFTAIYTLVDNMSEKIFNNIQVQGLNNLSAAPDSIVFEQFNQFDTMFQILKSQTIMVFNNQKNFELQEFSLFDMIDKSDMTILNILNTISDLINQNQALQTIPADVYIIQLWVASTDATMFEKDIFINLNNKQVFQTSVTESFIPIAINCDQIRFLQRDSEQVIQGLQYRDIPFQQFANIIYHPQIYQELLGNTDVLDAGSIDTIFQWRQIALSYNQYAIPFSILTPQRFYMIEIWSRDVNLKLLSQNQKDLLAQSIKILLLLAPNQAIQATSFVPTNVDFASGEVETALGINIGGIDTIRPLVALLQQQIDIDKVDRTDLEAFLRQNMSMVQFYEDESLALLAIVVDGIIFG